MGDYIERSNIYKRFRNAPSTLTDYQALWNAVKNEPSADVVPIGEEYECGYTDGQMAERKALVHCKFCRKKDTINCPMYVLGMFIHDYDYCSYGERKEQDHE